MISRMIIPQNQINYEVNSMNCLCDLFNNNCIWILIVVFLLLTCGNGTCSNSNGCGCGCGNYN